MPIPVVDLFAGPGGLGEGFSRFEDPAGRRAFKIGLSIEKDEKAHETLLLRSFYRQSAPEDVPDAYYDCIRGETTRKELFEAYPGDAAAAEAEAWHATLGETPTEEVRERIKKSLRKSPEWVLIGGPPCQAYSVMGRSRNKGKQGYKAKEDHRQFLYIEYLQIIADHWPAVFVMENVKGLLSAALDERYIFDRILEDLESPADAIKREGRRVAPSQISHSYRVVSVTHRGLVEDDELRDFIVESEHYGIPQARHRLIMLGIRDDLALGISKVLRRRDPVPAGDVLCGLPRVRSGLSRESDNPDAWRAAIESVISNGWLKSVKQNSGVDVYREIVDAVAELRVPRHGRGGEFVRHDVGVKYNEGWFLDPRIGGACNHTARGHMTSDLHRYLFAACFAEAVGHSPELCEFPKELLPNHNNVNSGA